MITVNAIGDTCPIPVVKTKKAIEALTPVSYTHLDVYKRQTCNRIRVTADGRLMPCLGSSVTMDLVPDSCEFTDDLEKDFVIVQALKAAIKEKPGCHNFHDNAVTYTKTTDVYKRQSFTSTIGTTICSLVLSPYTTCKKTSAT